MKRPDPQRPPDIRIVSRVSVAGVVRRADGTPARGGIVELKGETSGSENTTRRAQRDAPIRADGSYFICDLPAGTFELSGFDERGARIEAQRASLVVDAKKNILHPRKLDLHLKVLNEIAGA
jgi:hypothetical protein